MYDAHQRPDAQQRTGGHDHVRNYKMQQLSGFLPFNAEAYSVSNTIIKTQFENETQKYDHLEVKTFCHFDSYLD